jgi:Tfp pilus assembly protein PilF/4-amino-4-deoxy-L-arabinose transferase-like glycosyltransferase
MQRSVHDFVASKPRTPDGLRAAWRIPWVPAAATAVLALTLRLLHLWSLRGTVVFRLPLGDGVGYDEWARRIIGGDWVGYQVFYQAPLYPYFLAVVYKLFGADVVCARVVQAFIGAGSCVLLADAGRSLFGRRVGWIAGLVLAVYPTAIFFDGLIQKSVLDLFFICAMLCLLGRIRMRVEGLRTSAARGSHVAMKLLLGAVMGALVLTRENAILLLPVAFVWVGVCTRLRGGRAVTTALLLVALGVAAVLLPVAVRNKIVGGEFHLTTSQLGPNLYIGNHPGASGTYEPLLPGRGRFEYERTDATVLAEQAAGHALSPAEVSAYWVGRVREFVISSPQAWLGLMKTKALLLVNKIELTDTEDQYTFAQWSPVLRWSSGWLGFGLLIPLAVGGVILCRRSLRRTWVVLALALVYAASVVAFYVVARYRFPLVPMLILPAVAGLVRVVRRLARSRQFAHLPSCASVVRSPRLNLSLAALATSLTMIVCLTPRSFTAPQMMASTYGNIGEELARHPETEKQAPLYFLEAIHLFPINPHAYINLATCFIHMKLWREAVENAGMATSQAPHSGDAWYTLGIALAGAGRLDDALAAYRRAIALEPARPEFHTNLGNLFVDRGAFDEALPFLKEAARLRPANAVYHFNLGSLLARVGRLPEAIASLEQSVALDPKNPDALYNLALAYRNNGRSSEAVPLLERYLTINPNDADARMILNEVGAGAARPR